MLRLTLTVFMLPTLLLLGSSSENSAAREKQRSADAQTETTEKLIAASGSATIDLDLDRLNDAGSASEKSKPLGPEPSRRARGSEPAEELVAEGQKPKGNALSALFNYPIKILERCPRLR